MNHAQKALNRYLESIENKDRNKAQYWDDSKAITNITISEGNFWLTVFSDGSAIFWDGAFEDVINRAELLRDLPAYIIDFYKDHSEEYPELEFEVWDFKGTPTEIYTQILAALDEPVVAKKDVLNWMIERIAAIDEGFEKQKATEDISELAAIAERLVASGRFTKHKRVPTPKVRDSTYP
jgi:hypothetical protein